MLKTIIKALCILLLSACQMEPVRDEDSPRSRLTVGSSVVLHRALNVPAGHSRVFLQFGEVVARASLERYQPHCNFEVHALSRGDEVIQPDSFAITKVVEDEEEIVQRPAPTRLAALDSGLSFGGGEIVPMVSRFVRHSLHSERQPDVMYLTCHGGFAEPWKVKTPSVNEIRRALGELATLSVARTD